MIATLFNLKHEAFHIVETSLKGASARAYAFLCIHPVDLSVTKMKNCKIVAVTCTTYFTVAGKSIKNVYFMYCTSFQTAF